MPWAARPNGSAAAPTAGLGALRPLLGLQSFAPARGRAASLDGCALPPRFASCHNGGVGADRLLSPLGPPRGLIDTSGALMHLSRDGFGRLDGVALVAPSASYWPSETRSRHAATPWCCPDDAKALAAPRRAALCAGEHPVAPPLRPPRDQG